MLNKEYREKCLRTLTYLDSDKLDLCHMLIGLNSELAELVSCVGTELTLKNIDRPNLGEELGDQYWYICNYCNLRDLPIPESEDIKLTAANHMCLDLLIIGIGELNDIVKKYIVYGKTIEKSRELEYIYKIFSALYMFENVYGLDGGSIRNKNIQKLQVRFPEKFSEEKALNRDLKQERKTLE